MDMKYLKSFNESSKSGKMNKKHRRNILREVNKRMKEKFDDFQSGEFEKTQDEYIDIVCKEKGWSLKDFYATDGRELEDLLGM
jgi:hypothetical protein